MKNLIDLCRLNLMEERLEDRDGPQDEEERVALDCIQRKRRELVGKIAREDKKTSQKGGGR